MRYAVARKFSRRTTIHSLTPRSLEHALQMNGQEGPWSLRKITQALESWGYECHLLSPTQMIPLSGEFWQDSYEIWYWSNFICAQRCDADLLRLARAYNKEVQIPRPDCPSTPSPV